MVGNDRIKKVARFTSAGSLHFFMLWILDNVPELEEVLDQRPQLFFGLTARAHAMRDPVQALELAWQVSRLPRHRSMCEMLKLPTERILDKMIPRDPASEIFS